MNRLITRVSKVWTWDLNIFDTAATNYFIQKHYFLKRCNFADGKSNIITWVNKVKILVQNSPKIMLIYNQIIETVRKQDYGPKFNSIHKKQPSTIAQS